MSCAHCGCALVAEKKKAKYVYYHCTGNRGKCNEPWVREEELSQQFGEALKELHFDPEVLEWVRDTLRASHADEKEFHDKVVADLQKQYQKLQDRIDAMYVDKLDGNISGAYFEEKNVEWRHEQADIRRKIDVHEQANQSYIEEGIQLLELGDKAYDLYTAQPPEEQRRLLNCVVSHATWGNGSLSPVYRPPFDLIAHSNREYACNHKGSDDFEAQKENWLPGPELIRTFLPLSIFCSIAHSRKRRFYRLCYGMSPTHAQLSLHERPASHDTSEERARRFQAMLDSGQASNRADLARLLGCSRAWVTKVLTRR